MTDLRFRVAERGDIPQIVTLVNNCYRGETSKRGWTTEADLLDGMRTDADEIETRLGVSVILLCEDGDEIVGSVNIEKRGSECYLGMFVVNPDLQGGGIGKQVIEAAENYARDVWGSEKMTMTVITSRTELVSYYVRRGYRRTGEIVPFKFDDVHAIAKVDGIEMEVLEKIL